MTKAEKTETAQTLDDAALDAAAGGFGSRMFNPQPEPPAVAAGLDPAAAVKARGFNPQPEPPAVVAKKMKRKF